MILKLPGSLAELLQQKLLGPGLVSLMIKMCGAIMTYGMFVAFARLLSPEHYGQFAFGMNLAIIAATIGGVGSATAIMRFWPQYTISGDDTGARSVVYLGYAAILAGGLAVLFLAVLTNFLPPKFTSIIPPTIYLAVAVLGLIISLGDYSSNLLRAQGSILVSMLPRDVFWRIFSVLGLVLCVLQGFAASGVVALAICAGVLAGLTFWQFMHVRRRMAKTLKQPGMRNDWLKLRGSVWPLWASSVVFALIQQFDVVVVGTLLGTTEAGAYFAAQKTAMLLSLALIAAGMVGAPKMAALFHANRMEDLQRLCRVLAGAISIVTIIGFFLIVFAGKYLLAFFDPGFVSAYPVLLIVALGCVVDAMSGPSAYLMQMTVYEKLYLRVMLVSYLFVLSCQLVLVPRFGIIGAACSSTAGVILWNVWSIYILRRKAGLDPSLLSLFKPPQVRLTS